MNWVDIKSHVTLMENKDRDYQDLFMDADIEIEE